MTRTLMIAGGGTGGHIYPAIAIAQEWMGRGAGLPVSHEPVVYQYAEVAHQQQGCGEHQQQRRAGAATDIVVQKYEHRGEWRHGSSS